MDWCGKCFINLPTYGSTFAALAKEFGKCFINLPTYGSNFAALAKEFGKCFINLPTYGTHFAALAKAAIFSLAATVVWYIKMCWWAPFTPFPVPLRTNLLPGLRDKWADPPGWLQHLEGYELVTVGAELRVQHVAWDLVRYTVLKVIWIFAQNPEPVAVGAAATVYVEVLGQKYVKKKAGHTPLHSLQQGLI